MPRREALTAIKPSFSVTRGKTELLDWGGIETMLMAGPDEGGASASVELAAERKMRGRLAHEIMLFIGDGC